MIADGAEVGTNLLKTRMKGPKLSQMQPDTYVLQ